MLCLRRFSTEITQVVCFKQPSKIISGVFLRHASKFVLAHKNYEGDQYVQGETSPVVVIHGMLGSKKNWHTFCKSYSGLSGKRVIAVDCRNHGQSPRSDVMNYPLMAADVAETLQQLNISKTILIGHSMGGKTAMEVALSMPNMVEKLVLVDISPFGASLKTGPVSMVPMVLSAMVNLDLTRVKSKKDADDILAKSVSSDGLRAWVLTSLFKNEKGKFHWSTNIKSVNEYKEILFDGVRLNKRLPYPGETLFIGGGESGVLRNVDMNELRKMFPKAKLEMIPGAGHFVHADKPKEFLEMVHSFLR